jgi:hypothetical protein
MAAGVSMAPWGLTLLAPALWVVSAVFQNLFIGLYLNSAPVAFDRLLLPIFEVKSIVLVVGLGGMVAAAIVTGKRLPAVLPLDIAIIAFVGLVAVSFLTSTAPWVSKLAYLRNFTAFMLLHLLGRWAYRGPGDAHVFVRFLLVVATVMSLVSIVSILWPGLWSAWLNVTRIEAAKGPISHVSDFLGFHVRRLKSAVGEPVNAGYIFACLALIALTTRRLWLALILVLQLGLTFAKGPILIFGTGFLLFATVVVARIRGTRPRARVFPAVAVIGVLSIAAYVWATSARVPLQQTTTWAHVVGLGMGLSNAVRSPLGQGVGTGGNYLDVAGLIGAADRPDPGSWLGSGAESAVGVVGTQLGWIGLVLFWVVLVLMIRETWRAVRVFHNTGETAEAGLSIVACGGLFGICFTSLLQEGALSPQAAGLFFLLSGMVTAARLGRTRWDGRDWLSEPMAEGAKSSP